MAVRCQNILSDARYLKFRERYYDDFAAYVLENCPETPTWQQMEMIEACSMPG